MDSKDFEDGVCIHLSKIRELFSRFKFADCDSLNETLAEILSTTECTLRIDSLDSKGINNNNYKSKL